MDQFKKDHFYKEFGENIQCERLNEKDNALLNTFIESKFGVAIGQSGFFNVVQNNFVNSKSFDSLDAAIDIEQALQLIGLLHQQTIIVIWHYPGDMDKFDLKYLVKHWEDIWYGPSDDGICLFFPDDKRMILITHYDTIYY